jgi:hypothetical protein
VIGAATPIARSRTARLTPGLHQPGATVAQPQDVAALVAMVDRLMQDNADLVRTVAAWQSQAVVLAGRLADAQERLAISAPSQSSLGPSTEPEPEGLPTEPSPRPEPTPWPLPPHPNVRAGLVRWWPGLATLLVLLALWALMLVPR